MASNTPTIPNPTGIDVIYNQIQESISTISWIDKSYGKSKIVNETRDNQTYRIPKVYNSKREYISLEPDDRLKAFSFIEVTESSTFPEYNPLLSSYIRVQNASLIVWANLERISNVLDYNYEEVLLQEVLYKLNLIGKISDINSIDQDISNTWNNYSYSIFPNKYFKENYATFRINFTITLNDRCYNDSSFINNNC